MMAAAHGGGASLGVSSLLVVCTRIRKKGPIYHDHVVLSVGQRGEVYSACINLPRYIADECA